MTNPCPSLAAHRPHRTRRPHRTPRPIPRWRQTALSHAPLFLFVFLGACFHDDAQKYWSASHGSLDSPGPSFTRNASATASGGAFGDDDGGGPVTATGLGGSDDSRVASSHPSAGSSGGAENAGGNWAGPGGEPLGGSREEGGAGSTPQSVMGGTQAGGPQPGGPQPGGPQPGGAFQPSGGSTAFGGARPPVDLCPDDPHKMDPGACGCGVPETKACLVHRYSFSGTGTEIIDSVGTAHGTAMGCSQSGGGDLTLADSGYISLPLGILSSLKSTTLEAWVTWYGGAEWQRIVDFGNSVPSKKEIGGETYVYLTAKSKPTGTLHASFSLSGSDNATDVEGPEALPTYAMTHVALALEALGADSTRMILYMNGVAQGSPVTAAASLSRVKDVNNWLGRSQFSDDPYLTGALHEFRIYNTARTASQIQSSYQAGPDQLPDD